MFSLIIKLIVWLLRSVFLSPENLVLENLALRQQINVLQRRVKRPRLRIADQVCDSTIDIIVAPPEAISAVTCLIAR